MKKNVKKLILKSQSKTKVNGSILELKGGKGKEHEEECFIKTSSCPVNAIV